MHHVEMLSKTFLYLTIKYFPANYVTFEDVTSTEDTLEDKKFKKNLKMNLKKGIY